MSQGVLFRPGYFGTWRSAIAVTKAPSNHADTSIHAAASIRPEMGKLERITLQIIRDAGKVGATNEQISRASSGFGRFMPIATVCPRTNALARRELICDSGRRRAGASGRPARVWVVARAGIVAKTPVEDT